MPILAEVTRSPRRYLGATLAVVGAATRVSRWYGREPFDQVVRRLRGAGAKTRCDPRAAARVVGRLLPLLPPWRMGRCLKRSLILVDLWSRAGLHPCLHLGFRPGSAHAGHGHAWLSVDEPGLADLCGHSGDSVEVMVL